MSIRSTQEENFKYYKNDETTLKLPDAPNSKLKVIFASAEFGDKGNSFSLLVFFFLFWFPSEK